MPSSQNLSLCTTPSLLKCFVTLARTLTEQHKSLDQEIQELVIDFNVPIIMAN